MTIESAEARLRELAAERGPLWTRKPLPCGCVELVARETDEEEERLLSFVAAQMMDNRPLTDAEKAQAEEWVAELAKRPRCNHSRPERA